jgi:pimeloyl-ACP methyl ester carboxylesterase
VQVNACSGAGGIEGAGSGEPLISAVVALSPETRYATTVDGVHVAFQVIGEGPPNLVFVPPAALSHVEAYWEEPQVAIYLRRLASFSRLIMFDKRGIGMSDRVDGVPTLEERMEDVRTVMDAADAATAAVCGISEGGAIGAMFAATYPERVSVLILLNAAITNWLPADLAPVVSEYIEQSWGQGQSLALGAPSVADDERVRAWAGRVERLSASPATMAAMVAMNTSFDARSVLPAISTPTLVMHRLDDRIVPVEQGREAAQLIPTARYVELPGSDHLPFFEDPEVTLGLVEEFVTGTRHRTEPDRVLATVVFTDIVASTERASRLGDRRWKETLDAYDALVSEALVRFRGRLVKSTGDGTLATFDGPGRAIRCAEAIRDASHALDLDVRAGVHTGEIELRGEDVTGMAVVIGHRVSELAGSSEVVVSSTVRDLVAGSGIEFDDRGERELKGVPGTWHLFAVKASSGR